MTENEFVVEKVLEKNPNYRLKEIKHEFHNGLTDDTKFCIRSCFKCHSIEGFFVAIFEKNSEKSE